MAKKPSASELAGLLGKAVEAGDTERVRELLTQDADPDRREKGRPTPLIRAADGGHIDIVKELLTAGADPNFVHGSKDERTTALLEAIRSQHFDVATALIAAGADPNFDTGEGRTVTEASGRLRHDLFITDDKELEAAACLRVLRELLAAGGKMPPGPLQRAARAGDDDLVSLLLDAGVDVNQQERGYGFMADTFSETAFSNAVWHEREEPAVELLRAGADPWIGRALMFGPPPHEAVVKGLTKVVRALVETKADLNRPGDIAVGEAGPLIETKETDARGHVLARHYQVQPAPTARKATLLIAAVRCGREEMVRILAEGGADLEATDADGFTALAWAMKLGRDDLAGMLRHAGAKEAAGTAGSPQFSLVTAAAAGDLAGVRQALAAGADASATYDFGNERATALMRAAEAGHAEVVAALLEAGADPNRGGLDSELDLGVTPLILAARKGHAEVVRQLLAVGANLKHSPVNVFALLRGKGKLPALKRLLADDADPTAQQAEIGALLAERKLVRGYSAVEEAAKAGHSEVVDILLVANAHLKAGHASRGALEATAESGDVRTVETALGARRKKGRKTSVSPAALMNAARSGDRGAMQALLDTGADVNKPNRRGDTALSEAVARSDIDMVKLLLAAGAKPKQGGERLGTTELMTAAGSGYAEMVQLLIDAGVSVDATDRDGTTALHWAASLGHVRAVEALLEEGASIQIRDDEGHTPLDLVRRILAHWDRPNPHPLVNALPNLEDFRRAAELLERAGRQ